jgi:hypothetical protein
MPARTVADAIRAGVCTILLIPSDGSTPWECGERAVRVVSVACRCGRHSGVDLECAGHVEAKEAGTWESFCHACEAAGHHCPVTVTVTQHLGN